MFILRNIRSTAAVTTRVVLILAFVSTGILQTASAQESDAVETTADYRDKSLLTLRQEAEAAEANFYSVFNSVNDDSNFDVVCEKTTSLGSRRKVHQCKPTFLRKYEEDMGERNSAIMTGSGNRSMPSVAKINKQQEQFQEKLSAAISENPEMLKALNEFANAKRILESESQRR